MMMNKQEMITWSSQFECGIKLIDDQHKGLVVLINEMHDHATGNVTQERDYFNRVIQEAVDYVKIHFATEEKIMRTFKFDGLEAHKKEHLLFIRAIVEKINDFNAGSRLTLSSFARFLKDWTLSHIGLTDKLYFEYLRKNATIKEDGKLTISVNDV